MLRAGSYVGGVGEEAHGEKVLIVFAGIMAAHFNYFAVSNLYRLPYRLFFIGIDTNTIAPTGEPDIDGNELIFGNLLTNWGWCFFSVVNEALLEYDKR